MARKLVRWVLLFSWVLVSAVEAQPVGTWNEPGLTPLMAAASVGAASAVSALLESSPELVNAVDSTGFTALVYAVEENQLESARLLLKAGADPNIKTHSGWTALMSASSEGRDQLVELLVDQGAHLETGNGYRWTAVHHAVLDRRYSTLKLLLERGASPNAASVNGLTPLMEAARKGDRESAELLIRHGGDPDLVAEFGKSAIQLAEAQGHSALARFLEENRISQAQPVQPAQPRSAYSGSSRYHWSCQFPFLHPCWILSGKRLP